MKKHLTLGVTLVAALCGASTAFAAPPVTGAKVLYVGTYGDGRLFVGLDKQIQEPGCAQPRFDVAQGNPSLKSWTAVALAAYTSGKTVTVAASGCLGLFPTMTPLADTYFYVTN